MPPEQPLPPVPPVGSGEHALPRPLPLSLHDPRRTSPFAVLFWVFRGEQLRALIPVVVIAASSGQLVLVLGLGVVVAGLYGLASWWRRTWWFADGVLHLDEGILTRNQRRIPVERIQHVELERRLRHQLFRLASVRVETAGGSGAELRLDTIALAEAEALRHEVLDRLRAVPDGTVDGDGVDGARLLVPAPATEILVRLPPGRLLLAGVTGPEVLAVLAALIFAADTLGDLGVDPTELGDVSASRAVVAVLALVGVPAWFLVAGLISVVRRWDLTASIVGDELRVTYGLLRKNEFVLKTERVQDARIAHRLLLRPFSRADLRIRTAASGQGDNSRVDIPLLDAVEIERILGRVLPAAIPLPTLAPAPYGARRRALVRSMVVPAVVAVLVGIPVLASSVPAAAAMALLLIPVGGARGILYYRGLGHATERQVVHGRSGTLTRHHSIVPQERIQSAATVASWFQRRRDLAHVRLDLAGAAVSILDRSRDDADGIAGHIAGLAATPR